MNLYAVAVLYFLMFSSAIWIDRKNHIFLFPKQDQFFLETMLIDVFFGLSIALVVCGLSRLMSLLFKKLDELSEDFSKLLGPLTMQDIFFISAFSALAEEFFFRGVVQHYAGLVPASALFGLMHVGPSRKYLPWTVFAIAMGFLLGGLYTWRKNLILPTTIHFLVNVINLYSINRRYQKLGNT